MGSQIQQASRAPLAIRDADVLIVGGGPIGSVAATLLHQRGVHAVLIERVNDFLLFNRSHAYALGLLPRAFALLAGIPGMLKFLKPWQAGLDNVRIIDSTGKVNEIKREISSMVGLFMRYRVTHLLKTFMCTHTDTDTHYGAQVVDISFLPSGQMDVRVRQNKSDGTFEHLTFHTRLILACDGRNSTVVRSLRNADGRSNLVHSTKGFGLREHLSPAVGLCIRTLILRQDAFAKFGLNASSFENHITAIRFDKSRSHLKRFRMTVFPTVEKEVQFTDGVLGAMARVPDHELWRISDVDEAYDFFAENFPQFDVRKMVLRADMEEFANAQKTHFPTVARVASLVARVGDRGRDGGVILLGDAAHSFPPDSGQGANSGFDDLAVLIRLLDAADPMCTIGDLLQRFEDARDKDISALMRIAQLASPYQYEQVPWRWYLALMNSMIRRTLAKWLPRWFHPSLAEMSILTLPYSEIMRRADVTTRRICVVAVFVGGFVFGLLAWVLGFTQR